MDKEMKFVEIEVSLKTDSDLSIDQIKDHIQQNSYYFSIVTVENFISR